MVKCFNGSFFSYTCNACSSFKVNVRDDNTNL
jgi:hypothetical protein